MNVYFSQIMKRYRADAGLTQQDVANILGVSKTFITKIETSNNRLCDPSYVKLLEKGLRLSADQKKELHNAIKYTLYKRWSEVN